jgi:hypothetical protein
VGASLDSIFMVMEFAEHDLKGLMARGGMRFHKQYKAVARCSLLRGRVLFNIRIINGVMCFAKSALRFRSLI